MANWTKFFRALTRHETKLSPCGNRPENFNLIYPLLTLFGDAHLNANAMAFGMAKMPDGAEGAVSFHAREWMDDVR